MLQLKPISLADANAFVLRFHRHSYSTPRQGGRWAVSVESQGITVAVAIAARPVARLLAQDPFTVEVVRVCTSDTAPKNCCSMLYRAIWRAWRAMGGRKLVTYTLEAENGVSLKAAGLRAVAKVPPSQWSRCGRPRKDQAIYNAAKIRWELSCEESGRQIAGRTVQTSTPENVRF